MVRGGVGRSHAPPAASGAPLGQPGRVSLAILGVLLPLPPPVPFSGSRGWILRGPRSAGDEPAGRSFAPHRGSEEGSEGAAATPRRVLLGGAAAPGLL